MKFTDGMEFNLQGDLRITRRADGMYLVGNGMLIPISTQQEGIQLIKELSPK